MTLVYLLVAALLTAWLVGFLAKLPARQHLLLASLMSVGVLVFYGLVELLA